MDVSTYEGSMLADVQADPDDTAISVSDDRKVSPSTPLKETFRLPHTLCS